MKEENIPLLGCYRLVSGLFELLPSCQMPWKPPDLHVGLYTQADHLPPYMHRQWSPPAIQIRQCLIIMIVE